MSRSARADPSPTEGAIQRNDTTRVDPSMWRVAAAVLIGPFMSQLDATVVNVSLPAIRQNLHATTGLAQWIITGYLLALALVLPLNGWLVDRVGAKRLYLACFAAFTAASALCATAHSMHALIFARLLQGAAGGMMAPMPQMMLARVAGPGMARIMGYVIAPVLIAPILGPVIAGAILTHASWPWLFLLNLPVGIAGIAVAQWLLPHDEPATRKRPFDLPGFLFISPGLTLFLYGLPRASGVPGMVVTLTGVALIAAFIRHAIPRPDTALLDVSLFRIRTFSAAAATQFLSNGAFYARQFLVPLFLITGCGVPAGQAGWIVACAGLGMLCSFPLVGTLTDRFGCRAVATGGALLTFLGATPFLWMAAHGFSPTIAIISLFAMGAGQGTINIPSISAAYASVPKDKIPFANTAITIVQRLGGPIATALAAIVLALPALQIPRIIHASFLPGLIFMSVLQLLTVLAANRLPRSMHA